MDVNKMSPEELEEQRVIVWNELLSLYEKQFDMLNKAIEIGLISLPSIITQRGNTDGSHPD